MHGVIWWILVGLIAGWLAGKAMKGGGFGVLMDIVVGMIGAVIGGWLVWTLGGFPGGGFFGLIPVGFMRPRVIVPRARLVKKGLTPSLNNLHSTITPSS